MIVTASHFPSSLVTHLHLAIWCLDSDSMWLSTWQDASAKRWESSAVADQMHASVYPWVLVVSCMNDLWCSYHTYLSIAVKEKRKKGKEKEKKRNWNVRFTCERRSKVSFYQLYQSMWYDMILWLSLSLTIVSAVADLPVIFILLLSVAYQWSRYLWTIYIWRSRKKHWILHNTSVFWIRLTTLRTEKFETNQVESNSERGAVKAKSHLLTQLRK